MKTLKHIIRGCGYLPHCGEHSGTIPLVFLVLLGIIAGANGGLKGALYGGATMLLIFGSFYLVGAYERSVMDEKISQKENT